LASVLDSTQYNIESMTYHFINWVQWDSIPFRIEIINAPINYSGTSM